MLVAATEVIGGDPDRRQQVSWAKKVSVERSQSEPVRVQIDILYLAGSVGRPMQLC